MIDILHLNTPHSFLCYVETILQLILFVCKTYTVGHTKPLCTGSHSNSEVKRLKAWLVLKWGPLGKFACWWPSCELDMILLFSNHLRYFWHYFTFLNLIFKRLKHRCKYKYEIENKLIWSALLIESRTLNKLKATILE